MLFLNRTYGFFLGLLLVSLPVFAADSNVVKPDPESAPSYHYNRYIHVGTPKPIVDLPNHIVTPDAELSLFADFENRDPEKGIPLYLVNRTHEEKAIPVQDGDAYIKLEYQDDKEFWNRAQTHRSATCGNSYYAKTLQPGEFFHFYGYSPSEGTRAKVRYRSMRSNLVSNEGDGFYLDIDRNVAELDTMSAREIPSGLSSVLHVFSRQSMDPRNFSDNTFVTMLDLLSQFSESPYYRNLAREKLGTLDESSAIAKEIQAILDREWPRPARSIDSLINRSLDLIEQDVEPTACWTIISSEVRYEHGTLSPEILSRVARVLEKRLMAPPESEVRLFTQMLDNREFTNSQITTEKLLAWLHSDGELVVRAAAQALADREKFEDLLGVGREIRQEHQYAVLGALARGRDTGERGIVRRPYDWEEIEFWKRCLSTDTVKAFENLPETGGSSYRNSRLVMDPVRDFLNQKAIEAGDEPAEYDDIFKLTRMVRFLGHSKEDKDAEVLKKLLTFPWYDGGAVLSSRSGAYTNRNYRVRNAAFHALKAMGRPVLEEVVVEEKILPTGEIEPVTVGGPDNPDDDRDFGF